MESRVIMSDINIAKKENDIWHRRGFLTATYQGGEEKIWTERRQEKKQKPW